MATNHSNFITFSNLLCFELVGESLELLGAERKVAVFQAFTTVGICVSAHLISACHARFLKTLTFVHHAGQDYLPACPTQRLKGFINKAQRAARVQTKEEESV